MTQPIIFLDIDGVLTTRATQYRTGDPKCVAELNHITDSTGAAIVVSSTWRHDPKIADILRSWGVTGEVIGVTPDLARPLPSSGIIQAVERGEEIAQWLLDNEAHRYARFVILDDDNDMGHFTRYLVRTGSLAGLQASDAERAIHLLLTQVNGGNS